MADLEQRVTRLEERSEAQTAIMDYLRQDMADLRRSTEALASDLRGEMALLRTDLRGEMSDLRATVDSRFHWLDGLMFTVFVVTIGTIAGALWAVLQSAR